MLHLLFGPMYVAKPSIFIKALIEADLESMMYSLLASYLQCLTTFDSCGIFMQEQFGPQSNFLDSSARSWSIRVCYAVD